MEIGLILHLAKTLYMYYTYNGVAKSRARRDSHVFK